MKKLPGTLFLIVGNSGSGKDSIISGALKNYPPDLSEVVLVKRYITRTASEFEDNYSISEKQFAKMKNSNQFALSWHIYGLNYGIHLEIDDELKKGHPVIANVSRMIVEEAKRIYENIKIIFIRVPFEITLERVKARGREEGKLLEDRIERARLNQELPTADFIVDNSGKLEEAIDQFLRYLIEIIKKN